jgi:hypothetical protein
VFFSDWSLSVQELLEESAEGKSFFEMAGGEGAAPLQAAVASTLAALSKPQRAFLLLLAIFPGTPPKFPSSHNPLRLTHK